MLDIDGGPDVNPGLQQFLHVLPALRVPGWRVAAGQIRVRQLIHQQNGRMPRKRSIKIKFSAGKITVANRQCGQSGDAFREPLGLDSAVRFDVSDHHIGTRGADCACRLEHGVGLAHACR